MAFINDYTTEEEKRLLASFKDDPKTTLAKDFDKNPFNFIREIPYWTVDRERQSALVSFGIRDRENPFEGEVFVFLYKELSRTHFVRLLMKEDFIENEEVEEKAKAKYGVKVIKIWGIREIDRPSSLSCSDKEIFTVLAECLSIYDLGGYPEDDVDSNRCKAFVEYDGKFYGV